MITSIIYLILLIIFGVLLPINGILSGKRIKELLASNPGTRIMFYKNTIILQIVLAAIVLASMAFHRDPVTVIGLSFLMKPLQVLGFLTACFLGWWLLWIYPFNLQKLSREIEREEAVKFLLPASKKEYLWSIGTSFAAGIGEEIVFRGFLYWQFAQVLPIVPAILLTNFIFGLCHYGTGPKKAILTFGLGILLSIIFLYTKSLWILMLIHVLYDVYSMTKGMRYFDQNPEENIVSV